MFLFFISLRIKQFIRILDELGFFRVLLLLVVIGFGGKILIPKLLSNAYSTLIFVSLLFSVASIHFSRKDKKMLKALEISRWRLYVIEYVFISFPFLLIFILTDSYLYALITLSFIAFVSCLNFNISFTKKRFSLSLNFIPATLFEWKSGLRKTWFYILFLFFTGIVFSKHIFIIPLYFAVISIIVASYYFESEPRSFVACLNYSPRKFLVQKIISALKFYSFLAIPMFILFLFMHIENLFLLLFVLASSYLIVGLSIILKYAFYEPCRRLDNNLIIISLCVFCFLVPYLAAIPIILLFIYYRKAQKNLKLYL